MPISVTQVTPSQQEATGKAFTDYVKRFSIKNTDLDTSNQFYIPLQAGETVLALRMHVEAVFDAVNLIVGDSSDADGFLKTGVFAPDSATAFANSALVASGSAGAFYAGKHYTATDYLVFTASGSSAKGELVANVLFDGYGTGPGRDEIKNI